MFTHIRETFRHSGVFAGWWSSQFLSVEHSYAGTLWCAVTAVTVFGVVDALADCDIAPADVRTRGVTRAVTRARRRRLPRLAPVEVDMTRLLAVKSAPQRSTRDS
ncbi:hypothetical protein GCM10010211_21950 [Streptomyces albospinus]|uniref:Uncharacterized protein n=1 Tax=Streptomyces albospinus TaxID=285515 RepID=A0ABQ2UVY9_9ACTN|nr:hypothetical protein GCM10010211_21950 [Streptomyces albospinus]